MLRTVQIKRQLRKEMNRRENGQSDGAGAVTREALRRLRRSERARKYASSKDVWLPFSFSDRLRYSRLAALGDDGMLCFLLCRRLRLCICWVILSQGFLEGKQQPFSEVLLHRHHGPEARHSVQGCCG